MSGVPERAAPLAVGRPRRRRPDGRPAAHQAGRYVPLVVTVSWSVGTIAAFAWGPFKYRLPNALELYLYLTFVHLAVIAGYLLGSRARPRGYRLPIRVESIVRVCVLVSLAFFFVSLPIAPDQILGTMRAALSDPDLARSLFIRGLGGWRDYAAISVAPLTSAVIPLGIFFWGRVGLIDRLGVAALLLLSLFQSVASASRHGLWATMIIAFAALLVAHYGRMIRIRKAMALAVAGSAAIGFMLYANFIAVARIPEGANPAYPWTLNADWIDEQNPIYALPPRPVRAAVIQGFSYFTHGYRGLALALDLPFRGITFGVGNSMFLTRNAERLFGAESIDRVSIPKRLVKEYGYSDSWWMTEYPWIASDVTFPGSVVVLFVVGYLMASAFRDATIRNNPFAVIMFTWIVYFMFSLPQGSITQDGSAVVAIASTFGLWRLLRLRPPIRDSRFLRRTAPPLLDHETAR